MQQSSVTAAAAVVTVAFVAHSYVQFAPGAAVVCE